MYVGQIHGPDYQKEPKVMFYKRKLARATTKRADKRHLSKGATAKVKIQLTQRMIPLETFKENKQLGRILLRKGGETVAAGVVDEVRKLQYQDDRKTEDGLAWL